MTATEARAAKSPIFRATKTITYGVYRCLVKGALYEGFYDDVFGEPRVVCGCSKSNSVPTDGTEPANDAARALLEVCR